MNIEHQPYMRYYKPKKNDIWLDLGASTGELEKQYLDIIINNNIKVYCIEPQKANFEKLKSFCDKELPNNCICINKGIWEETSTLTFLESDHNERGALSKHLQPIGCLGGSKHYQVQTTSLDDLLTEIENEINWCKCDIEGAELEVFRASRMLPHINNLSIAAYHLRNLSSISCFDNLLRSLKDESSIGRDKYERYLQDILYKRETIRTISYLRPFFELNGFNTIHEESKLPAEIFNALINEYDLYYNILYCNKTATL